jgi:hypothetical protein
LSPGKKSVVLLRLIVSWYYSFFCPERVRDFGFRSKLNTESSVELCDSASGAILLRSFKQRQAEFS